MKQFIKDVRDGLSGPVRQDLSVGKALMLVYMGLGFGLLCGLLPQLLK